MNHLEGIQQNNNILVVKDGLEKMSKNNNMKEQIEFWKHIEGYEFLYKVSNFGNVKSLPRVNHKRVHLKGKDLKPTKDGGGYYQINLSKNGKHKLIKVHQLVAMAFLNHKPCGHDLVVNHIDFNRTNNNVLNLEVVTQRQNSNRKHLKSSSKFIGVNWNNGECKWQSDIKINGKAIYLGTFDKENDASKMYNKALENIEICDGNAKSFRNYLNKL